MKLPAFQRRIIIFVPSHLLTPVCVKQCYTKVLYDDHTMTWCYVLEGEGVVETPMLNIMPQYNLMGYDGDRVILRKR